MKRRKFEIKVVIKDRIATVYAYSWNSARVTGRKEMLNQSQPGTRYDLFSSVFERNDDGKFCSGCEIMVSRNTQEACAIYYKEITSDA